MGGIECELPPQEREPKLTIVFIDDSERFIDSISRFLRCRLNANIITYTTAKEALEKIEKDNPSIVFVDGQLENDEGWLRHGMFVVSEIREKLGDNVFIIAFSGEEECNKEMMNEGANMSVGKNSVRVDDLVVQLKQKNVIDDEDIKKS